MPITQSLIILVFAVVCASPQQSKPSALITDEEFQHVLVAVSDEDWDTAVELSSKYLKPTKVEDERLPRLRYIYLYSAAGQSF